MVARRKDGVTPAQAKACLELAAISGVDANGSAADGEIEWNFGHAWGLGDSIGPDEYDFASTAMHELLHSFKYRHDEAMKRAVEGLRAHCDQVRVIGSYPAA